MSETLKIIRQTHKTILFEEFTDRSDEEVPSLYDIINSSRASGTFDKDAFYRKIEDNLVVKSFDEFLERFAPKVYECIQDVNGLPVFSYTTNKQDAEKKNGKLIKLEGHPFFKMLVSMYSQKGDSGLCNIDFPENEIREILTPAAQMRDVYDMRKKLRSLAIDYAKAIDAGQNAQQYEDAIYDCRVEISERFQDSPRALLSLAITETTKKIENYDADIKQLESAPDGEVKAITTGSLGFDGDGKLVVIPVTADAGIASIGANATLALEERAIQPVLALVEEDVRGEYGPKDEFSRALVLSAYAPPEIIREAPKNLPELRQEVELLKDNKKMYEDVYRQAQDAFIKTLVEAAQKMLCVKVFFDHATVKGGSGGKLPAGLLVANCKASTFLQNDDIKKDFQTVMESLGHAREGKKIWLGILPDVRAGKLVPAAKSGQGLNRPLRPRAGATDKNVAVDAVDLRSAISILKIMDECNILTVFSFMPEKENCFADFGMESVEKMENLLADVNNPHAVLAYPNFTVMDGGTLKLGDEKINIPPVHVGAAYVAAAMIAASQQPDVLEAHGLGNRLIPGNVCTRIDLEDEYLKNNMTTKFNRELAKGFPSGVIPHLEKRYFGFVFCSDPKKNPDKNNAPINNTYIIQARTLKQDDNNYMPVAHTLTQDFIDAYMREFAPGESLGEELVSRFEDEFKKWKNEASKDINANKLNVGILPNEKIEVVDEDGEKIFLVSLKGGKVTIKRKVKIKNLEGE